MAGVVGHPVSEKGERGGSPSPVFNGNARSPKGDKKTELACFLERETALVNGVVSDGFNRYPEQSG